MTADALLSRLDRVKATGRGRWQARCPAHDDKAPSLSIRELDDDRVLVHCFTGCSVEEVLAAVGLDFDALFPERAVDHRVRRQRDPFDAKDVLAALADEVLIAGIVATRIYYAYPVNLDECRRMNVAIRRIMCAADLFKPHPAEGKRAALSRTELDEVAHA